MKRWYFSRDIERASGWQMWSVEADTMEEAKQKFDKGEREFADEEVEVTSLSNPYFSYSEEVE